MFTAKNKKTGEKVAVKSLKKTDWETSDETEEEVMTRVRAECGIYLTVDHPNIVRLRDMYETEVYIYLVCDCCTGGELYDRLIKRGQYSERDAARGCKGGGFFLEYEKRLAEGSGGGRVCYVRGCLVLLRT